MILLTCPQNLLQWCSRPFASDNDYVDMPTELLVTRQNIWQRLCWNGHGYPTVMRHIWQWIWKCAHRTHSSDTVTIILASLLSLRMSAPSVNSVFSVQYRVLSGYGTAVQHNQGMPPHATSQYHTLQGPNSMITKCFTQQKTRIWLLL